MPNCAVSGCPNNNRNTKTTDIKYYRFPKSEFSHQWVAACANQKTINLKNACVCSVHFDSDCFEDISIKQKYAYYTGKNVRDLKPDAIPTLNLPNEKNSTDDSEGSAKYAKRIRLMDNNSTSSSVNYPTGNIDNDSRITSSSSINEHSNMEIVFNQHSDNEETHVEIAQTTETREISKSSNQPSDNEEIHVEISQTTEISDASNQPSDNEELILQLRNQITALQEENVQLKQAYEKIRCEWNDAQTKLNKIFSPGQINRILNSGQKCFRWSPEDIASAISLRSVSPKAYRYLRANGYPLSALSTLRSWASSLSLVPGILEDVVTLMDKKSSQLKDVEKICILSFDEIYVSNRIDIEKREQKVIGPHKTCQTVMARGIVSSWKQPVFYNFDQAMTKDILNSITSKLYDVGFIVVGIVSDMGSSNVNLWSKLNIGHDKNCFFEHPINNLLKIFVFADAPHLLKLLRNHILDQGFWVNGTLIGKNVFENLLNISSSELSIAYKISRYHLDLKNTERQKVRPAAQLLSNTISKAIGYCGKNGLMPAEIPWENASEFVKLINDWFDLFNSRSKLVANDPTKNSFGTDLENQEGLLLKVSNTMSSMTVGRHKSLIPFQKGILLSNRSLKELFIYLKSKYGINYILTSRLNQDVLENFFSYIRGMGATNDHPHPLDFMYRLRWYILEKNSSTIFTESKNIGDSDEKCLAQPLQVFDTESSREYSDEFCLTQSIFGNMDISFEASAKTGVCEEEERLIPYSFIEPQYTEPLIIDLSEENLTSESTELREHFESREKISKESLKYIAGYVAYKFKNKYSNLGHTSHELLSHGKDDWIQFISRGGLLHPSKDLFEAAEILDAEFYSMDGASLSRNKKDIFRALANKTMERLEKGIPYEVILCLSRTRTYIRLRELNKQISFQNLRKRMDKKLSKFSNTPGTSR